MKLTFPPRPRAKWLLITIRLSTINFAGTARTEVAVGISKLASIFVTTRAEVPLSFSMTSSASDADTGFALDSAGAGAFVAAAVTAGVNGAEGVGVPADCAAVGATEGVDLVAEA